MADPFKLPSLSIEHLKKIIIGYAHLGENIQLDSITNLVGVSKTRISSSNPFLTNLGIIEGGRTKRVTPVGSKLGRALEHNHEEDIRKYWKEVIQGNEFLSNLLSAVRIRKGISEDDLIAHVLYSSGLKKTQDAETGARATVDILIQSGLLEEMDGKFQIASAPTVDEEMTSQNEPIQTQAEIEKVDKVSHPPRQSNVDVSFKKPSTTIAINIQLQLPETENATVYENLFKALREHLIEPSENSDAD